MENRDRGCRRSVGGWRIEDGDVVDRPSGRPSGRQTRWSVTGG